MFLRNKFIVISAAKLKKDEDTLTSQSLRASSPIGRAFVDGNFCCQEYCFGVVFYVERKPLLIGEVPTKEAERLTF